MNPALMRQMASFCVHDTSDPAHVVDVVADAAEALSNFGKDAYEASDLCLVLENVTLRKAYFSGLSQHVSFLSSRVCFSSAISTEACTSHCELYWDAVRVLSQLGNAIVSIQNDLKVAPRLITTVRSFFKSAFKSVAAVLKKISSGMPVAVCGDDSLRICQSMKTRGADRFNDGDKMDAVLAKDMESTPGKNGVRFLPLRSITNRLCIARSAVHYNQYPALRIYRISE